MRAMESNSLAAMEYVSLSASFACNPKIFCFMSTAIAACFMM